MRDKGLLARHGAYLARLLRHKWYVLEEGRKLGVPLLQLLLHDLSKFLPDEWQAGVTYHRHDVRNEAALGKHYARNRHHPQWWAQRGKPVPMPMHYRLEMLADWRAMAREKGGEAADWYTKEGHMFPFHPETRAWVEARLRSKKPAKTND